MARLVVQGERFDSLSSTALLEREYEALILQEAATLFPDLIAVPFKVPVEADGERKKPDLAILDPEYRTWWVGEVELAHHSLSHVLAQVVVFARGAYGDEHAEALAAEASQLDPGRLRLMMRGAQPQVSVIVNQHVPEWVSPLRQFGASVTVVEVFRSPVRPPVFRVNGQELTATTDFLSECRPDPTVPKLLVLESPAAVALDPESEVEIDYQGSVTRWRFVATADRAWLNPVRGTPFPAADRVRLVRKSGGRLAFVEET